MDYLGNKEILNQSKIGFLCSRKVPANIILKTYDWAIEQKDNGVCIVSGFHSKIEKDVFDILIKGRQPIILVLARGMLKRFDKILLNLIDENRLLIISPFDNKVTRPTNQTAIQRNQLIAEISDKILIPFAKEGGNIDQIKNNFINKMLMIK
jgi:predicted Rossmann fold nucleotide-binding protein DprA/Smf involved in DNA uptake